MRLILPTVALLSTLLAWPAVAQDCQPVDQMKAWLAEKHQETPVGSGISLFDRNMVVLFAKPDGSSFTVIKVSPQGNACIVEIGEDWQTRNDAPAVPEAGL